jgi:hypothetical protein
VRPEIPLNIEEVNSRKKRKGFIGLPAKIYRNHPVWVAPLYSEEWKYFDPRKNKAFSSSDAVLYLAYRGKEIVGRIMGVINHRYNEYRRERNARFGFLECWDDQEVAHALLARVEAWAKAKNIEKVVGPMGFSDQDPEGYLVEGFDCPPTLATYYNHPYLIRLLENEGYNKEVDYVVYKVDLPKEIPEFYRRIYDRVARNKDYTLVEFSKKKELKAYIRPVFQLMNDCYRDNYAFSPLTDEEIDELGKRYLPLCDPRFIKIVKKDEELVGFQVAIPNMADGFRRAKGRLFPFGIFTILRSAKKAKQLDLMLGGIKDKDRGRGVDVMLGMHTMKSAIEGGFTHVDSHHELETNYRMRAEMERIGGIIYKRFRIFQKKIENV